MAQGLGQGLPAPGVPHPRGRISSEAVTTRVPSGLNWAETTEPSWRRGSVRAFPLRTSHTRAVLSSEAVTTRVPSGLNWAEWTEPSWRRGSVRAFPLRASHTRAVLSSEAVTTRVPSGLNWAEWTGPHGAGARSGPSRSGRPTPARSYRLRP